MDIDFLVDEVVRKRFPFNLSAFNRSPVKFDIGVTEYNTGNPVYFSKDSGVDYYELLRATCAMPYFYGKCVQIGNNKYCDGTISELVGLDRAANDKKVLIILTQPDGPAKKIVLIRHILRWLLIRKDPIALQEKIWSMPAQLNALDRQLTEFKQSRNVCVLRPSRKLPVKRIDASSSRLGATIEQGYADTINNRELESFWLS